MGIILANYKLIINTFTFEFLLILLLKVLSCFIVNSHAPIKNILVAFPKLLFKDVVT